MYFFQCYTLYFFENLFVRFRLHYSINLIFVSLYQSFNLNVFMSCFHFYIFRILSSFHFVLFEPFIVLLLIMKTKLHSEVPDDISLRSCTPLFHILSSILTHISLIIMNLKFNLQNTILQIDSFLPLTMKSKVQNLLIRCKKNCLQLTI